jgi:type VI secretion system protein ImpK
MTLLELSEPLFQYLCRLNRSARKGGNYELGQVQSEIKGFLTEAKAKSVGENLSEPFEKIELPLMFFCDFMIKELAFERHEMAGDEKFFDLLEETLKDKSPAANGRLTVFYTCIGLGFTGWYTSQPEYLRRKMKEIAARLQAANMFSDAQRICADAYEKVDTRDLIEPPGMKLLGIAIVLFGLIIVLFVMYAFLFSDSSKNLNKALQTIQQKSQQTADTGKEAGK